MICKWNIGGDYILLNRGVLANPAGLSNEGKRINIRFAVKCECRANQTGDVTGTRCIRSR